MVYQICKKCIMDTTDPDIIFDSEGACNYCNDFEKIGKPVLEKSQSKGGEQRLLKLIDSIKKKSRNRKYDCVVGISGGVDSSFVAYKVKELGLNPLAVHCDNGWNTELAVSNIESIVKNLDLDLITYVINWQEMKDLQLSFFKASVANCDIPSDHCFLAVLYQIAKKYKIPYIISGGNMATEYILPEAWGYNAADLKHIKAIHSRFGNIKLNKYPMLSFFNRYFYYPIIKNIIQVRVLDYIPYNKSEAKEIIIQKFGWRDYGGKHYESIFTKFFQSYYLPQKFGFDKRRAHLSSLVVSGQMTRQEAEEQIKEPLYCDERMYEDKCYIAKKLGINVAEFDRIINLPIRSYKDFPSNESIFRVKNWIVKRYKNYKESYLK